MGSTDTDAIQENSLPTRNIILTKTALTYIEKGFKFGETIAAHPFLWNDKTHKPEMATSKFRIIAWKLNVLITTLYYVFLTCRHIQLNRDKQSSMSVKIYMIFMQVWYTFVILYSLTFVSRKQDIQDVVTKLLDYLSEFENLYVLPTAQRSKLANYGDWFARIVHFAFSADYVVLVLATIFFPQSPELITSIIPMDFLSVSTTGLGIRNTLLAWAVHFFFVLFQFYVITSFYSGAILFGVSIPAFILPMLVLMDELSSRTKTMTKELVREPAQKMRLYKSLYILFLGCDEMFRILISGSKVCLILVSIFCTYGAIKFGGFVGIALGVIGLGCFIQLFALFSILGEFYAKSTGILRDWDSFEVYSRYWPELEQKQPHYRDYRQGTNRIGLQYYRKYLRTLKPLSFKIGGLYFIDRFMVMTMLDIIVSNTVNLVIMYP